MMRPRLRTLPAILLIALCNLDIVVGQGLRPAAIVPWSEYQKRLHAYAPANEDEDFVLRESIRKSPSHPLFKEHHPHSPSSLSREGQMESGVAVPAYSTAAVNQLLAKPHLTPKTRPPSPSYSVIRPQLRSRRPDDPRVFARKKIPVDIDPPLYHAPKSKPQFAMVDARAPGQGLPPGAIKAVQHQGVAFQNMDKSATMYQKAASGPSLPSRQLGANTFDGGDSIAHSAQSFQSYGAKQFSSLGSGGRALGAPQFTRIGPAPAPSLSDRSSNIVNSIFSQSQGMPQTGFQQAAQAHGVSLAEGIPHGVPAIPQHITDILTGTQGNFQPQPNFGNFPNLGTGAGGDFGGVDTNAIQNAASNLLGSSTGGASQRSPFEGLLANGSPLESFSKIAQNLLGGNSAGGGQGGNLLDAMTNVLTKVGRNPGLGTANLVDAPVQAAPRPEPSLMEKLFSTATNALDHSFKESMKEKQRQERLEEIKKQDEIRTKELEQEAHMTKDVQKSLTLLEGLPEDQRSLLEKALKEGEIDAEALAPAVQSLVKDDAKEDSQKEKVSRLIEWIRANRPARPAIAPVNASDKLPYYGKYCGSLAAPEGPNARASKPSGALWAVDNERFIVSKFYFQPSSLSENVTFWLGPESTTLDQVADSFPSANGFYVRPDPIDVNVFVMEDAKSIPAKARHGTKAAFSPIIQPASLFNSSLFGNGLRVKRDAIVHIDKDELPPSLSGSGDDVKHVVAGSAVKVEDDQSLMKINESFNMNALTVPVNGLPPTATSLFNKIVPRGFELRPPLIANEDPFAMKPLDWFAGFQPLLIRLPPGRKVKSINWVALRDHKKEETIASIILPNAPAFTVPAMTQLRPLTPNGLYNISSGHIKVHDYKTIEITNLVLKTEGLALWFMIGTDILPNTSGNIVPIYNKATKTFDCESLRDYNGESVTLRLPGKKDINDVFWLSVFSIPNTVSYSHIYLPYNEMVIPPDLSGIATPECVYTP